MSEATIPTENRFLDTVEHYCQKAIVCCTSYVPHRGEKPSAEDLQGLVHICHRFNDIAMKVAEYRSSGCASIPEMQELIREIGRVLNHADNEFSYFRVRNILALNNMDASIGLPNAIDRLSLKLYSLAKLYGLEYDFDQNNL